ncbi:MAG: S-layer homology domain-containing protein [Clostridia bacterium]|nr:S-layer homology domain-containing protein [Clostridia bacterium]
MKKLRFFTSLIITCVLVFACCCFATAQQTAFSDLKKGHWAKGNIDYLVERGAINGYPDGTFRPSATITGAEFLKIAAASVGAKIKKTEKANKFWYEPYVEFARDNNIIESEFNMKWNSKITRAQMAYIVAGTAGFIGENTYYTEKEKSDMDSALKDLKTAGSLYSERIYKVVKDGIITGYEDGTFRPEKTATRAEASAMLSRLFDKSKRVR